MILYQVQMSPKLTKLLRLEWRNNSVHGMYADGSTSTGATYGAWLVMNTKVSQIAKIIKPQ